MHGFALDPRPEQEAVPHINSPREYPSSFTTISMPPPTPPQTSTNSLNSSTEGESFEAFVPKFSYRSWLVVEHAKPDLRRATTASSGAPITPPPSSSITGCRTATPDDRKLWLHRCSFNLLRVVNIVKEREYKYLVK